MKLIFYFVIALIWFVSICGCGHNGNTYVLNEVESVIKDNPDSAINMLKSLDTTLFESAKEKALYHLLMAEALYRSGYNQTLSDHVAPAVEYYKEHGPHKDASRAYFYSGINKYNQHRYSSAAVDLLRSESISKEENDTLQLAFVYRALGDNFLQTGDLKSSLSYYQKSYDYFTAVGAEKEAASVQLEIEKSNQIDTIMANVDLKSTYLSVKTLLEDGTFEEMLDSIFSGIDIRSNDIYSGLSSNLGAEVISYKQFEEDLLKEAHARERLFWVFIIVLSLLSVSLVGVLIFKRNRALKLERDSYMMAVDDLDKMIKSINRMSYEKDELHSIEIRGLRSAVNDSRNTIRNLISTQFADLSELCQTYFLYENHKNAQAKVYNKVRELVTRFNSNEQFIKNLETMINRNLNNLMSNFRRDFPNLNEWEYPLFMYNVCGLESGTIALFLGERADLVYKRKANLKRKIATSSGSLKEEYLSYLC